MANGKTVANGNKTVKPAPVTDRLVLAAPKPDPAVRRRWLRGELDRFSRQYHALLGTADGIAVAALDRTLEKFCTTQAELVGYWSRFTAASDATDTMPLEVYANRHLHAVWQTCQTRRAHLALVIAEMKD